MNMSGKKLTSKEAAHLLGVSEASVKRWAGSGILPMEKKVGGHRRFCSQDIALFRHERQGAAGQRPTIKSSASLAQTEHFTIPFNADDETLAREIFEALLIGRIEQASAILVNAYLRGERRVAALCDSVLAKKPCIESETSGIRAS